MPRILAISALSAALAALAACAQGPPVEPTEPGWPGRGAEAAQIDSQWVRYVLIPDHLGRLDPESEAFAATAVFALDSGDFASYSSAAAGLIELGEPVLPYLGYVGDAPGSNARLYGAVTVVMGPIFEEIEPDHVRLHLDSPYRAVRAAAATAVGERELKEHAGRLVDLLEDDRTEVRHAAIRSLRQLYNRFFGYRADEPARRRARAVVLWRQLLGSG